MIYPADRPIRLGIVVGTHGTPPYVHLQLESHRRFAPGVPVVVHDDASDEADRLRGLSEQYGAEYRSTPRHLGSGVGELACFATAIEWAQEISLDLVVKLSRRFVFTQPWVDDLCYLANLSQAGTFSASCDFRRFGFRTECTGMHVDSWVSIGAVSRLRLMVRGYRGLVEADIHRFAREVRRRACPEAETWYAQNEGQNGHDGYARWPVLGSSRAMKHSGRLWHESDSPEDYAALAWTWNLKTGIFQRMPWEIGR